MMQIKRVQWFLKIIFLYIFCAIVCVGKEREHNLQAGDNVEVCEGELINLQGKILSVDGNKITIMPKHEDLKVNTHIHTLSRSLSLTHWLCHVLRFFTHNSSAS